VGSFCAGAARRVVGPRCARWSGRRRCTGAATAPLPRVASSFHTAPGAGR